MFNASLTTRTPDAFLDRIQQLEEHVQWLEARIRYYAWKVNPHV